MDLFSGYDQMLLGQTETEINEPTTQQNGEMPSPFESQAVEEETFNHLKNGGGMFDGMGATQGVDVPALLTQIKALRAEQKALIASGKEGSPREIEIIHTIDGMKEQIRGVPLSPEEQKLATDAMSAAEVMALQNSALTAASKGALRSQTKTVGMAVGVVAAAALVYFLFLRKKA